MGVLYEHWDPILDECFYVGISWAQEDTRPFETSRGDAYNKRRAEIIAQGGVPEIRVTKFPGIAREALGNLEVLVIAHWRQYIGDRLTNRTEGGEGIHVIWDDEMLEKQRKVCAARWQDPEYYEKQLESRNTPEALSLKSVQCTLQWKDDEIREKRVSGILAHNETDKGKNSRRIAAEKSSVSLIGLYKTPKGKELAKQSSERNKSDEFCALMKTAHNTPEAIKNHSDSAFSRWASTSEEERKNHGRKSAETRALNDAVRKAAGIPTGAEKAAETKRRNKELKLAAEQAAKGTEK